MKKANLGTKLLFREPIFYSIFINLTEQRSKTQYTKRDKPGLALFLRHLELHLFTMSLLLYN